MKEEKKGLVIKSTGNRYKVLDADKDVVNCIFKGKYKIKGIRSTNPIAVGDNVSFIINQGDETGLITHISDRKNYIIRRSTNLSKETQIIAANIDLAFLIVSITKPTLRIGFIDRFLSSAVAYRIPVQIIFNKVDLYTDNDLDKMKELISIYEKIGNPCHVVSAINKDNIDDIKSIIAGKICLFTGNSGVGKSTLANAIEPGLDLKTSEISNYHKKGKHTTTFAQMFELSNGGFLIDTPGIKGFGIHDMQKEEIYHFFPEIFKESANCKFNNCTHTHEPGCAVIKAVADGKISNLRYKSYVNILEDDNDKHRQKSYK